MIKLTPIQKQQPKPEPKLILRKETLRDLSATRPPRTTDASHFPTGW